MRCLGGRASIRKEEEKEVRKDEEEGGRSEAGRGGVERRGAEMRKTKLEVNDANMKDERSRNLKKRKRIYEDKEEEVFGVDMKEGQEKAF